MTELEMRVPAPRNQEETTEPDDELDPAGLGGGDDGDDDLTPDKEDSEEM